MVCFEAENYTTTAFSRHIVVWVQTILTHANNKGFEPTDTEKRKIIKHSIEKYALCT